MSRENKSDKQKNKTPGKTRFVIWLIVSVTILIVMILAVKNNFWIKGDQTRVCIKNLRNLGTAVRNYHDKNQYYPANLQVLKEQQYIDKIPKCPLTGKTYVYDIVDIVNGDIYVRCPNPEKHIEKGSDLGLRELYYHPTRGIIAVPMK